MLGQCIFTISPVLRIFVVRYVTSSGNFRQQTLNGKNVSSQKQHLSTCNTHVLLQNVHQIFSPLLQREMCSLKKYTLHTFNRSNYKNV